jgi:hypothetical protein
MGILTKISDLRNPRRLEVSKASPQALVFCLWQHPYFKAQRERSSAEPAAHLKLLNEIDAGLIHPASWRP